MKDNIIVAMIILLFLNVCAASDTHHHKVIDIHHWTTPQGTQVYFVAAPQVPMLDIKIAFDAGSARDGNTPGIAALTNALLDQGSQQLDATAIAENFENVGAQFSGNVGRDKATVHLRTLTHAADLKAALTNFEIVMNHPDFPAAAFEQKKAEQAQDLQATFESPASVASDTLYATVYKNQPYSTPVLGTESSIPKLTLQNVNDFYHQYYVAKNATIAIVGAIDVTAAKQIAQQLTNNMATGQTPAKILPAPPITSAITKHIEFPSTQTVICLAQVGISHDSPDYFPLLVGNYTLGGGNLVSRLANEVREKRGLSYYIYSYFNPLPARGPFIITLATRTQQAPQALDITRTTLQQFLTQGPSADELQAAKEYITGSFPLRLASNANIADTLLSIGFYHLPLDYLDTYVEHVNAINSQQIQAAFNRHVQPQALTTITVGKNV